MEDLTYLHGLTNDMRLVSLSVTERPCKLSSLKCHMFPRPVGLVICLCTCFGPLLAPLNCFSWQDVSVPSPVSFDRMHMLLCWCLKISAVYLCLLTWVTVTRCGFENLSFLTEWLIFLIYQGKRFRAFTTPRTKWRASKRWLFSPPLVFSICAPSLCKSLHAARHLDCTLGQRYEHNFKRQSRDGGAPWWFHHWQDPLQASGSDLILISGALSPVSPFSAEGWWGVGGWEQSMAAARLLPL